MKAKFYEIQDELEAKYAVRLVSKARDAKGRGKALDEWHCHPVGRGRADKQDKDGSDYTILGSLPPSRTLCSICWMGGHWKGQCKARDLAHEMYEPALVVLQPKEKIRGRSVSCSYSLHWGLPFRIVNIDLVKQKKELQWRL